jgi:AraC-like DNA-binding protein
MNSAAPAITPLSTFGDVERHHRMSAQLLVELSRRAPVEGANVGLWPGLTIYRFTRPTKPRWGEIERLSVGIVVAAGKALTAFGGRRLYGRIGYVVIGSRRHFDCHILEASARAPVVCIVMEIDPHLVRSVSTSMGGVAMAVRPPVDEECAVSAVDDDLMDAVSRFLGSLSASGDRRVLAPLHLQEMVYRMLQGRQRVRLVQLAAYQAVGSPVAAALDYIATHFAQPMTVEILAAQVCLSPSAFSRVFRETTGRSPYQYVKETRLECARQLFDEGRHGVADVSREVGYLSVSHFIKGFRGRFGATPGDYADVGRLRLRAVTQAATPAPLPPTPASPAAGP